MKSNYIIGASIFLLFSCQGTSKDVNETQNDSTQVSAQEESIIIDQKKTPDLNKNEAQVDDKLKVIYAVGGEGKNVDWTEIKKQEDAESEQGFFYHDCYQGVEVLKASSTLVGQGKKSYKVSLINDNNPMTAWVEGTDGYGISESFEVKSANVNVIYNGYQSSPANWKNNSRVKKFKVYKDNKPLCYLVLTDEMGAQRFELPVKADYDKEDFDNPSTFKFEIVEVYKGDKWDDVAISEIDFALCCFLEGTEITSLTNSTTIEKIVNMQKVAAFDIDKNEIFQSEVTKVGKQVHVKMLTVSTATKTIQLTPDHPLYVKGYGFISLDRLRYKMKMSDFSSLIDSIELLTWNSDKQQQEYEKITSITIETGKFQTYSISQLTKGTNFIANGFVTKTY